MFALLVVTLQLLSSALQPEGLLPQALRLLFIKGRGRDVTSMNRQTSGFIPAQRTEGACDPGRRPGVRPLLGV